MPNVVNPANIGVANARRDGAIRRLKRQIDQIEGELRRTGNGLGANGMPVPYLQERAELLRDSRDKLQREVSAMLSLEGEALVDAFCPEVAEMTKAAMSAEPAPSLRDALQRGAELPQPVIVNRNWYPVRHEGPPGDGVPWQVQGGQGFPPGFVPGQVHYPDYASQGYDTGR